MKISGRGRPLKITQPVPYKLATQCAHSGYHCVLPCLENYEYCLRHILDDKTAPYKQCSYVFPTSSLRCFKAAPTSGKDSFCRKHACEIFCARQKLTSKYKPIETPETCLDQLSHHRMLPVSSIHTAMPDPANTTSVASKALDYSIEGSGNQLDVKLMDVMKFPRLEDDSDLDVSSDSDALDHLGVFTTEEVARIYLEKLQKLKGLYQGEFNQLGRLLKENKKEYLRSLKGEKETLMSIHAQPKESLEEKEAYRELCLLSRYQRRSGKEDLLNRQHQQRRIQTSEGASHKPPMSVGCVKCIYSEGSWKCGEQSIPLSKFCFKHILQDPNQVLFKKCNSIGGSEEECLTPVVHLPFLPACVYHLPIPDFMPLTNASEGTSDNALGTSIATPAIVDLSDSSAFVVSEVPPEDVMEGDILSDGPTVT